YGCLRRTREPDRGDREGSAARAVRRAHPPGEAASGARLARLLRAGGPRPGPTRSTGEVASPHRPLGPAAELPRLRRAPVVQDVRPRALPVVERRQDLGEPGAGPLRSEQYPGDSDYA